MRPANVHFFAVANDIIGFARYFPALFIVFFHFINKGPAKAFPVIHDNILSAWMVILKVFVSYIQTFFGYINIINRNVLFFQFYQMLKIVCGILFWICLAYIKTS